MTFRTDDTADLLRAAGMSAASFQLRARQHDTLHWQMLLEMEAREENRVTLSSESDDTRGDPVADIGLGYSERDMLAIGRGKRFLRAQATAAGVDPEACEETQRWRKHPAGTCRMGVDPDGAVVDANLKLFGLENLYISGASVFPTSGTANPTNTVVALALQLADHLVDTAG